MTEPLVSIKMITFNHAPYIRRAIKGVLQQKVRFPIELVIGEDCSTDGTQEIVFEYQNKYPDLIRCVSSGNNVGAVKNSVRTMQACRGKFVAFCEGDDYWHHPDKLQQQVDYLESHPECGLVYTSYDVYHVDKKETIPDFINYNKWKVPDKPTVCDFVENKEGLGLAILTCTVMVRRAVYAKLVAADPFLYENNPFMRGDTQLWAEILTISDAHYIPESMATHIITGTSISRSKDIVKNLQFSVLGSELMLYLCSKYNLPLTSREIHESSWCDSSLRLAFHQRNAELAARVRARKGRFTLMEGLRYYGAGHPALHHLLRTAGLITRLFRKKTDIWR
jgi:glycosyltransferase involved in cell wall biosynthesis